MLSLFRHETVARGLKCGTGRGDSLRRELSAAFPDFSEKEDSFPARVEFRRSTAAETWGELHTWPDGQTARVVPFEAVDAMIVAYAAGMAARGAHEAVKAVMAAFVQDSDADVSSSEAPCSVNVATIVVGSILEFGDMEKRGLDKAEQSKLEAIELGMQDTLKDLLALVRRIMLAATRTLPGRLGMQLKVETA